MWDIHIDNHIPHHNNIMYLIKAFHCYRYLISLGLETTLFICDKSNAIFSWRIVNVNGILNIGTFRINLASVYI